MNTKLTDVEPIDVLIVEDSTGDIRTVKEILKKGKICIKLRCLSDGVETLEYLRKEGKFKDAHTPDLILLDLGLPKKDGREVLEEIKLDNDLKTIPIIIMTISKSEEDILRSHRLHANAYIVKPIDINKFINAIKSIENFWLSIVKLPLNNKKPFQNVAKQIRKFP